jgi:hypothetical protein
LKRRIDRSVLWRSAALQVAAVAILSIALAVALPHHFFDDWGWLTGPAAWLLCAALTAQLLGLPRAQTLVGAALAGLVSVPAVLLGIHWLGVALAVGLFAAWCARLATRTRVRAWTSE